MQQQTPRPKQLSPKGKMFFYIIVIAIIVVSVLAFALMSNGNATEISQVRITVSYEGDWSGTYGDLGDIRSWDGSGSSSVTFTRSSTSSSYAVVANAQKLDDSSGTLTLKIVSTDGEVLKQSSTSAQYGFVQISWSP